MIFRKTNRTKYKLIGSNLSLPALFLGASATALSPIFVRLSELPPVASAFHRMLWAFPIIWVWTLFQKRPQISESVATSSHDRRLLIICGCFFAGDLIALHWSIELTTVANAILFLNAQPIYVIFGAWILFFERPNSTFLICAALALIGTLIMIQQSIDFGNDHFLGDILGIVAGLFYAGFILTASRLRLRKTSAEINMWTVSIACPLLLVSVLLLEQKLIPQSIHGWSLMISLGVISQAVGQGLIVWGLAHLSASFSSIALTLAPIVSSLFAWALLAEGITIQQMLGMGVVLIGIYFANNARQQKVK